MSRYCQFVLGPAGCGKSTYCEVIQKHYAVAKRTVHIINLDPAAEVFNYTPLIDIKDLISLDDVMESELRLGPNGGLMYCMDYLIQELVWLRDALEEADAENIVVDCPGQIELYLSSNVMQQLVQALTSWGYNVCSVYVIDCRFALDPFNFCGVVMSSQDAMVKLETPFIMVMMKVDLLSKEARKKLYRYIDPDSLDEMMDEVEENSANKGRIHLFKKWISVMENYPKSEIMPLNLQKPGSMDAISTELDRIMQYDEEREHVDEREVEYMDENGPSDYKQG